MLLVAQLSTYQILILGNNLLDGVSPLLSHLLANLPVLHVESNDETVASFTLSHMIRNFESAREYEELHGQPRNALLGFTKSSVIKG